ncbi:MAG: aminopeptidase P family protein [Sedimentisphaerales bacterium]
MFPADTYIQRRRLLETHLASGIVLFMGNEESPMNYTSNIYPFRQDSSFLFYFGLDKPRLAAVIDIDQQSQTIFGDDLTIEEIVWTGPQSSLQQICEKVGISQTRPLNQLKSLIEKALSQNRTVHYLPQYRAENIIRLSELLNIVPAKVNQNMSEDLIRAVVAQRSVKSNEEIEQIEAAIEITKQMHVAVMQNSKPGVCEKEIVGMMESIAISNGVMFAFPAIFSIHGETLHNTSWDNVMHSGDIVINDSGAESPFHYAGDITRTIPIGGKFSQQQREIYQIVYNAQQAAIEAIKPGVEFRNVHKLAATELMAGLKELGLIKISPQEAVEAGAHTLFFQCGLGHMMGLDVHDMECLGEDYVGYTDTIKRRNEFGWKWLRLAKTLETGYVVTVEPGIYFIPHLIDLWKSENKLTDFIDYAKLEKYRTFGGVRIEDDVLVTDSGCRTLGPKIPKKIDEVEEITSS